MKKIREKILWWAAKRRIAKYHCKIIAVGGAMAKTSTKKAIGTVMELAYPGQVKVGYGNLNSLLGVPLSILGFEIDFYEQKVGLWQWFVILIKAIWRGLFLKLPRYLVLEYGTDKPDDIKQITEQLRPDIGVMTIVGPAHLANYPSVEAMVKDEGYLAESVKEDGMLLVNSSDQYLTEHHQRTKARVVNVVCSLEEIAIKFMEALARELKIDEGIITKAREQFSPPARRFNYEKLNGINLLDDSYNASPLAIRAALHLLKKMPGRKVAILGDMRELGDYSAGYHKEIGAYAKTMADLVIAVGPEAKEYGAEKWFENSENASKKILADLRNGDSVLVKGSKSVHMELVTKIIRGAYAPLCLSDKPEDIRENYGGINGSSNSQ